MASYQWHWQRLWDVLNGEYPPSPPQEIPLITSLCYYSLTILLGRLLRLGVKHYSSEKLQPYLYDFITTFQVLACSLENGQIRKHYGNTAYFMTLLTVGLYTMLTVENGAANPGFHIIKYMKGESRLLNTAFSVMVQLAGGLLSYRYARLFWYMELTESHGNRYRMLHCMTDLNVPSTLGFAIEFGATLLDCLIWFNTFSKFHLTEMLTKCCFGTYMTLIGVDLTGWYMNPLNATNQNFGCHGSTIIEHLLVYWVGPISAVSAAVILQRRIDTFKSQTFHYEVKSIVSPSPVNNNNRKTLREDYQGDHQSVYNRTENPTNQVLRERVTTSSLSKKLDFKKDGYVNNNMHSSTDPL